MISIVFLAQPIASDSTAEVGLVLCYIEDMTYKLLVLAPSAGGKSTLMRYLRAHTDLQIAETDELVTEANNGIHPQGDIKNQKFIPETTLEVIFRPSVVYLANYIPAELVRCARTSGFKVLLVDLTLEELKRRNVQRMENEHYPDASQWFEGQLNYFTRLRQQGLVDESIDGSQPVETLAGKICSLAVGMDT